MLYIKNGLLEFVIIMFILGFQIFFNGLIT